MIGDAGGEFDAGSAGQELRHVTPASMMAIFSLIEAPYALQKHSSSMLRARECSCVECVAEQSCCCCCTISKFSIDAVDCFGDSCLSFPCF